MLTAEELKEDQPLSEVFSKLTPEQKKIFRSRQRLMIAADLFDMTLTEDLPTSKIFAGTIKQRTNRVKADVELISKELARQILIKGSEGTSKSFGYAMYTIMTILVDWDEDKLYDLAKELNERGQHG